MKRRQKHFAFIADLQPLMLWWYLVLKLKMHAHLSQRCFATGSMHAKDKFNNHEKSQAHSEACLKFSTFTQPNIIERMNVE
ncbi:hypothetical protein, partial [Streptococcus pneumoniae]|uniref:hypothetical protein n=1 Tax=Streptococcus pneumoniae TaxID=1313 RepID=UPI001E437A8A